MNFSTQLRGREAYPSMLPHFRQRYSLRRGAQNREPESAYIEVVPLRLATGETLITLPTDLILTPLGSESFAEKFVQRLVRCVIGTARMPDQCTCNGPPQRANVRGRE